MKTGLALLLLHLTTLSSTYSPFFLYSPPADCCLGSSICSRLSQQTPQCRRGTVLCLQLCLQLLNLLLSFKHNSRDNSIGHRSILCHATIPRLLWSIIFPFDQYLFCSISFRTHIPRDWVQHLSEILKLGLIPVRPSPTQQTARSVCLSIYILPSPPWQAQDGYQVSVAKENIGDTMDNELERRKNVCEFWTLSIQN